MQSVSLSTRRWRIHPAKRLFLSTTAALVLAIPGIAEEDTLSFVLAPPPVGYPVFSKGDRTTQAGGNAILLMIDQGGEKMLVAGGTGFGHWQATVSDSLSLGVQAGGSLLAGNKYGLIMAQAPLQANAVFAALTRPAVSLFLFGGLGADIGISTIKVTMYQIMPYLTDPVEDETSLTTLTTTGSINAGAQLNLLLGDFIISPFGSWTHTAGVYSYSQSSAMSFEYPSGSGTIEGSSSTTLGFDLLYRPWGISLSSMVRRTDSYTLITMALKRLIDRKRGLKSLPDT